MTYRTGDKEFTLFFSWTQITELINWKSIKVDGSGGVSTIKNKTICSYSMFVGSRGRRARWVKQKGVTNINDSSMLVNVKPLWWVW